MLVQSLLRIFLLENVSRADHVLLGQCPGNFGVLLIGEYFAFTAPKEGAQYRGQGVIGWLTWGIERCRTERIKAESCSHTN